MPIYEFFCYDCHCSNEELRKMGDTRAPKCSLCSRKMKYVVSAPTMHVWNTDREFVNVAPEAMRFRTKQDYESHLEKNHIAESSTDAPVKTPHGAEVTVFGDAPGEVAKF